MNPTPVELKSIRHRFATHWALADVSFAADKGESIAVLGPNGCGKSTLLKILATRLTATRGCGTILGLDLKRDTSKIRTQVEWLGHELGLYKTLSAEENLKFFYTLKGSKPDFKMILEVITKMGIARWKDKPVASFSIGMRKRLALARILLSQPKVILLDEPHANLDREGKQLMNDCLDLWKKEGVNVFLASHDHAEILSLCDKAMVLNEGRLVYFGDSKTIPAGVIL